MPGPEPKNFSHPYLESLAKNTDAAWIIQHMCRRQHQMHKEQKAWQEKIAAAGRPSLDIASDLPQTTSAMAAASRSDQIASKLREINREHTLEKLKYHYAFYTKLKALLDEYYQKPEADRRFIWPLKSNKTLLYLQSAIDACENTDFLDLLFTNQDLGLARQTGPALAQAGPLEPEQLALMKKNNHELWGQKATRFGDDDDATDFSDTQRQPDFFPLIGGTRHHEKDFGMTFDQPMNYWGTGAPGVLTTVMRAACEQQQIPFLRDANDESSLMWKYPLPKEVADALAVEYPDMITLNSQNEACVMICGSGFAFGAIGLPITPEAEFPPHDCSSIMSPALNFEKRFTTLDFASAYRQQVFGMRDFEYSADGSANDVVNNLSDRLEAVTEDPKVGDVIGTRAFNGDYLSSKWVGGGGHVGFSLGASVDHPGRQWLISYNRDIDDANWDGFGLRLIEHDRSEHDGHIGVKKLDEAKYRLTYTLRVRSEQDNAVDTSETTVNDDGAKDDVPSQTSSVNEGSSDDSSLAPQQDDSINPSLDGYQEIPDTSLTSGMESMTVSQTSEGKGVNGSQGTQEVICAECDNAAPAPANLINPSVGSTAQTVFQMEGTNPVDADTKDGSYSDVSTSNDPNTDQPADTKDVTTAHDGDEDLSTQSGDAVNDDHENADTTQDRDDTDNGPAGLGPR